MSTAGPARGAAPWLARTRAIVDSPSRVRPYALAVVALAVALLDLRAGIGPHDEGLMLQWGQRIASGEWPYRDFWCNYLPGQPLVQALLGDSLVTWRILRALTGAFVALAAYLLVRRETGSERWALGTWAGAAGAMAWPLTPGPNASALALALGAFLVARRSLPAAGVLAGLAFLFRPEMGVAAAAGLVLLAGRPALRRVLPPAGAVALAGLLPFLVVAPGALLSQTFGFASDQRLQRLPFPLHPETADPNKVLERLFPAVLVAGCVLWLALVVRRRRVARAWAPAPLLLAALAYLLARTDEFHLVPLSVIVAMALACAAATHVSRPLRAAAIAALALICLHGLDRLAGHLRDGSQMVSVGLPTSGGTRTSRADAEGLAGLAAAVDRRSRPGDPILVAPPRFDRVRVGDPLLYTLLDRTNPTRYDVMQPGLVTTRKVQREMIRDLERSRTQLVVRWVSDLAHATEDNGSGRSSGVRDLDDYIGTHFLLVGRYGDYLLLERPRA